MGRTLGAVLAALAVLLPTPDVRQAVNIANGHENVFRMTPNPLLAAIRLFEAPAICPSSTLARNVTFQRTANQKESCDGWYIAINLFVYCTPYTRRKKSYSMNTATPRTPPSFKLIKQVSSIAKLLSNGCE